MLRVWFIMYKWLPQWEKESAHACLVALVIGVDLYDKPTNHSRSFFLSPLKARDQQNTTATNMTICRMPK